MNQSKVINFHSFMILSRFRLFLERKILQQSLKNSLLKQIVKRGFIQMMLILNNLLKQKGGLQSKLIILTFKGSTLILINQVQFLATISFKNQISLISFIVAKTESILTIARLSSHPNETYQSPASSSYLVSNISIFSTIVL